MRDMLNLKQKTKTTYNKSSLETEKIDFLRTMSNFIDNVVEEEMQAFGRPRKFLQDIEILLKCLVYNLTIIGKHL